MIRLHNYSLSEDGRQMPALIYFLSDRDFDGRVLKPRIPDNFFTRNGFEDSTTKRVSFSTSVEGCLRGLSYNLAGRDFFVHIPAEDCPLYKPSTDEVPDAEVTGEVWVCSPVRVECIGSIHVECDTGVDGIEFRYGDSTAELYDWEYCWISLDRRFRQRRWV